MCLRVCISPRDSVSLRYLPLIVIIAMILLGRHSNLQTLSNNLSTFFFFFIVARDILYLHLHYLHSLIIQAVVCSFQVPF